MTVTQNNWTLAGPVARLTFLSKDQDDSLLAMFGRELSKIAGIKNKGYWQVPINAIPAVHDVLAQFPGIEIGAASWEKAPAQKQTWEEVAAFLRTEGSLNDWVYDFFTPYQKDAIVFAWNKAGTHFWHATGCVSGETELILNRGGKGFRKTIQDAYLSFHGLRPEGSRGKKWDPAIITQAQCEMNGVLRLNEVIDIVQSGVKTTYTVKAGNLNVRTTMDHRFYTPDGFKPLSALCVGDLVYVRSDQKSSAPKQKKKIYLMTTLINHPYANKITTTLTDHICETHRYKPGHQLTRYRIAQHRLVAEATLNGTTLEAFKAQVRRNDTKGLLFLDPAIYAVHHKNDDHRDNRPENLEVLTHKEHTKQHGKDGAVNHVLYKTAAVPIEAIELYGEEMTYDMCMKDPHNNFTANGFVVHNSGKTLTGIAAALSETGPTVVVTKAAARLQYAREIERFTKSRAYVVRPATEMKGRTTVKGESFRQFRTRHKGKGHSHAQIGQMWRDHIEKHGLDMPASLTEYLDRCKSAPMKPFIVVGWESLPDHLDSLMAIQPGAVILDESHKSKSTARYTVLSLADLPEDPEQASTVMRREANEAKAKGGFIKSTEEGRKMFVPVKNVASSAALLCRTAKKRLATTATAVSNRVRDLWSQLDAVEPNAWGNATTWLDRYADRHPGAYGGFDTSGESNKDELNKRLSYCTHILSYHETHKHLPPKRRQSVYVAPSDQVQESAGFQKEIKEAQKRGSTAVLEVKLAMAASKKRKAVLGLIEDHLYSKQKVIVFTARRRDCDELGDLVRKTSGVKDTGASVWVSHGEDSTAMRQVIVDEFMAHPGPCALIGTGHAFGTSLNLQDADALMFVMLPYTPEALRQWEGRVARHGQKRPVTVYFVIAEGTVDEHVAQLLISKLPAVEAISKDSELAEAAPILAGIDPNQTKEEFAAAVLSRIEDSGLADDDWSDWD